MNLFQWRQTRDLTLAEAASRLGLESARTYQRYETGENRPDAPLAEIIMRSTDGCVALSDLHQQRVDWLKANRPDVFEPRQPEAAE